MKRESNNKNTRETKLNKNVGGSQKSGGKVEEKVPGQKFGGKLEIKLEEFPVKVEEMSQSKGKRRIKSEAWEGQEIKKIFTLYQEYGSQWSLISTEFPGRDPNAIKNRFYTTIRLCLKSFFKSFNLYTKKIPHEIPSKIVLKVFQAQEEFSKYKGLCSSLMKKINYNPSQPSVATIVKDYEAEIKAIFSLIFSSDELPPSLRQSDELKSNYLARVKSEPMVPEQEQEIDEQPKAIKSKSGGSFPDVGVKMQLDGNQENMSGPPGMWSFVIQGADGNFYMQYMKPS